MDDFVVQVRGALSLRMSGRTYVGDAKVNTLRALHALEANKHAGQFLESDLPERARQIAVDLKRIAGIEDRPGRP